MVYLDQQIEQARARLRDLQARASKQRRRDETRRKIIYGAAFLALLEDLKEDQRARTLDRVHAQIARPSDRAFLDLPTTAS